MTFIYKSKQILIIQVGTSCTRAPLIFQVKCAQYGLFPKCSTPHFSISMSECKTTVIRHTNTMQPHAPFMYWLKWLPRPTSSCSNIPSTIGQSNSCRLHSKLTPVKSSHHIEHEPPHSIYTYWIKINISHTNL